MIHTPGGCALLQVTAGTFPGQSAALPEVEELQQKGGQQKDDFSACVCISTTISFGQRLGKALFGPWFMPAFALSNWKYWLVATLLINLLIWSVDLVYSNWKRCGVPCCLYPGQEPRALQVWFWTHVHVFHSDLWEFYLSKPFELHLKCLSETLCYERSLCSVLWERA